MPFFLLGTRSDCLTDADSVESLSFKPICRPWPCAASEKVHPLCCLSPSQEAPREHRLVQRIFFRAGCATMLDKLITRPNVNAATRTGRTPLHVVSQSHAHPLVITTLVSLGAKVDARDVDGATPLHRAASFRHEAVRELLKAGASIDARDNRGRTPLHYAAAGTPQVTLCPSAQGRERTLNGRYARRMPRVEHAPRKFRFRHSLLAHFGIHGRLEPLGKRVRPPCADGCGCPLRSGSRSRARVSFHFMSLGCRDQVLASAD